MGTDEWLSVDKAATFLQGQVSEETHVELTSGVYVPRRFAAAFVRRDQRMRVELAVEANAHGSPVVRDLTLQTLDDDRGVDRARLMALPVAQLLHRACHERTSVSQGRWVTVSLAGGDEAGARLRRTGGPGKGPTYEQLQELAEVFEQHPDRRKRQAVATHFHLSPDGASKWIRRARDEGLLPPPGQGRRKGER